MAIIISALIDSLNAKAIAQAPDASPGSNQVPIWLQALIWVLGLSLLCCTIVSAMRAVKACEWPTVEGTITGLSLSTTSAGSYGSVYEAMVTYQYTVDGQEDTGCRVAFGYCGSGDMRTHQAIYGKLHGASSVRVRYNRQNHAISTLSCGINNSIKTVLAYAIFFLGISFTISTSIAWIALVALVSVVLLMWMASQLDHVLLSNIKVPSDE
jgi:Protein of unknown function (DUF3592)